MRASPAVRGLRAAVFAALCVLLATGGHVLATGMVPPVWAQAVAFLPLCAAGYLLGGRERSLAAIGAATLTAQGGLHLAFDAVRPHTATAMRGMQGMGSGRASHVAHMMHGVRMVQPHMVNAHALTPHATAAHVSAAVVLTWWLRRGEAALWSLLRRALAFVPGLAAWWQVNSGVRGVPAGLGPVRPAVDDPPSPRRVLLRHAVRRRGPPTEISFAI
ncbi:hypothetical protein OG985_13870 [Streptomyces sp. NBC_00289]|uniref:hypothetical protein n=1 Tax=Streptomyces sp. NBC_00289 TaxID=2975703 RepID=UPI0032514F50